MGSDSKFHCTIVGFISPLKWVRTNIVSAQPSLGGGWGGDEGLGAGQLHPSHSIPPSCLRFGIGLLVCIQFMNEVILIS